MLCIEDWVAPNPSKAGVISIGEAYT
jgi:hypothetical protein